MKEKPLKQNRNQAVDEGHYARKQIHCKSKLISWSHQSRFDYGIQLASGFGDRVVLDYGCGDGTFLAMLRETDHPPLKSVGAEIADDLIRDCITRLGNHEDMEFTSIASLKSPENIQRYDALFCMEVLEHVVEPIPILNDFHQWLKPEGSLIVSVPVETGPALIIKQMARRIAGWRGLGDYPGFDPYTWSELLRGVFAGSRQHIKRPVHRNKSAGYISHDHKGFNWRYLKSLIEDKFVVKSIQGTPLSWAPIGCCSQVWIIATPRNEKSS